MTGVFSSVGIVIVAAAVVAVPAPDGPTLRPEAASAWSAYVSATEGRIRGELASRDRFLATDAAGDASRRRATLQAGEILIDPVFTASADGEGLAVPGAMVHHWRGTVLIPGATLDVLMRRLADGEPGNRQSDVLISRVMTRTPDALQLFLRVQRQKFVTVVYDTEHRVMFARHGAGRASTASTAVRIVEIDGAGTPAERALPDGEDRGFLWRWNAYWRYEQVPGGVIAECESVSLSRGVPAVVRLLAGRLIRSTARESMERTLVTFRDVFGVGAR